MSQLSDRSIRKLCQPTKLFGLVKQEPMITPFVAEKVVNESGKSYGLSVCSYDVRIAEDLELGPHPGFMWQKFLLSQEPFDVGSVEKFRERMSNYPKCFALANTIEDFVMPKNVVAYVVDKSSYARLFVSAFNTLMDPGFRGNLTLELVNLGDEVVSYKAGDPVCQVSFHKLDRRSRGYSGKYQGQPKRPVGVRLEGVPGVDGFQERDYGKRNATLTFEN